jgi:uncharacterized membrane protein
MHQWLVAITNGMVLVIDAMVLVIIAVGTIQAFVQGLRVMLLPTATGHERRDLWLHYARWLVAGLTFQLAADILATSIAPNWDELLRLAIVAVIRTRRSSMLCAIVAVARQDFISMPAFQAFKAISMSVSAI